MKQSFEIVIRPDRKTRQLQLLSAQWDKRTARFQKLIPYLAAEYVRRDMLERIPKTEDMAAYRASLGVAQVTGGPKEINAYALRSNMRHRRVRKVDAPKTVLYIRSKRQLRRVKPEVRVLERFSPWTLQTLPFMPKRNDALVISRRVSKQEADKVAKLRTADRPQWRHELNRLGKREVKKDRRLKVPKKAHIVPDVAFEALRMEFGLGGVKPKPHWRPSIRKLIAIGFKSMLRRDPRLKYTFTRLGFQGWKHWPPKTKTKIRLAEARNYLPFQRKLGIRI